MYQKSREAATDVAQLITELGHGALESAVSVGVSRTAAKVHDFSTPETKRKGSVTITLEFEHIPGTGQMVIEHTVSMKHPTGQHKKDEGSETIGGTSVVYIGPNGALTLLPPKVDIDGQARLEIEPKGPPPVGNPRDR